MRALTLATFLISVFTTLLSAQEAIPSNAHRVSWGKGWECKSVFVERKNTCVSLGEATDAEIRRYLITQSIRSYSGSCACPYNADRAGRRCGGRSAYSRKGGAAPLCFDTDISDERVAEVRRQYRSGAR